MPKLRTILMIVTGVWVTTIAPSSAQTLTVDEFRRELVGLPLCGVPPAGPLAGKPLCTVHLPDGTAILAGSGILVRGIWDVEDGRICRRNAHDAPDRRHCVDYVRQGRDRFRNSDNVEFCIGPCGASSSAAATSASEPEAAGAEAPAPSAEATSGASATAQPSPGAGPAPAGQGANPQGR
jgi:hypothetical protein